ncbi:MAG: hypothetical protein REI12_00925 [Pedobacter sp.]|nr:hypothetical protein [Pedobacter sp.]
MMDSLSNQGCRQGCIMSSGCIVFAAGKEELQDICQGGGAGICSLFLLDRQQNDGLSAAQATERQCQQAPGC